MSAMPSLYSVFLLFAVVGGAVVPPPLMQAAEEVGPLQLAGIFGKRMQEVTTVAVAESDAVLQATKTIEVPIEMSMTVPAQRARD